MRKLYLFTNTPDPEGDQHCLAMTDTGKILADHLCANLTVMRNDLIDSRPDRQAIYHTHFGGIEGQAFEVVVLEAGQVPPDEVLFMYMRSFTIEDPAMIV